MGQGLWLWTGASPADFARELAVTTLAAKLVLWSLAANRNDLWSVGLPLALAGQVGLVLGLLLQLDGISASSRRTEQTLTDLDSQLGELRSVTSLISSSRSGPSHSFYAHLTDGASPQILLSEEQIPCLAKHQITSTKHQTNLNGRTPNVPNARKLRRSIIMLRFDHSPVGKLGFV